MNRIRSELKLRSFLTRSSVTLSSMTGSWSLRIAGLKESMHGRGSGAVREFALFGETTGETDDFGLPVRYNWAGDLSRQGARRLWPHTRPRAAVPEQHRQSRHRRCFRRPAYRAPLSRARDHLRQSAPAPTTNPRVRSFLKKSKPRALFSTPRMMCSILRTSSASA